MKKALSVLAASLVTLTACLSFGAQADTQTVKVLRSDASVTLGGGYITVVIQTRDALLDTGVDQIVNLQNPSAEDQEKVPAAVTASVKSQLKVAGRTIGEYIADSDAYGAMVAYQNSDVAGAASKINIMLEVAKLTAEMKGKLLNADGTALKDGTFEVEIGEGLLAVKDSAPVEAITATVTVSGGAAIVSFPAETQGDQVDILRSDASVTLGGGYITIVVQTKGALLDAGVEQIVNLQNPSAKDLAKVPAAVTASVKSQLKVAGRTIGEYIADSDAYGAMVAYQNSDVAGAAGKINIMLEVAKLTAEMKGTLLNVDGTALKDGTFEVEIGEGLLAVKDNAPIEPMVITVKVTDGAATVEFPAEEEEFVPPANDKTPIKLDMTGPVTLSKAEGKYMVIDVFFNTAMTDNPDGQDVNIQQGAAAYITDENIVKAVNHCILVDGKTIREINQAGGDYTAMVSFKNEAKSVSIWIEYARAGMEYGGSHEIEFKTGVCNVAAGKADRPVAAFKGVYNEEDDIWTMSGEGAKADPVEPESSVPEENESSEPSGGGSTPETDPGSSPTTGAALPAAAMLLAAVSGAALVLVKTRTKL